MKEIQLDKKQNLEGKKIDILSPKPNNKNVPAEIERIEDSISRIKVVDLPRDPKINKFTANNYLNQLEQRFNNLINEQQSIRNTFNALFENTTSAVIILNENRQIEKINSNFIKLTGYEEADLDKKPHITNFFLKKDIKKVDRLLKNLASNEQTQHSEIITVQCLCKDGSTRYLELKCAKVSGQNQLMVLMNDITDRKTYEQEILRRNKELTVLNSISRLIKQPKDLQQILNPALEKTKLLIGTEMAVIYLGNQFIKNLQPIVTIGISKDNAKKLLDQNLPVIKQIKKEFKFTSGEMATSKNG